MTESEYWDNKANMDRVNSDICQKVIIGCSRENEQINLIRSFGLIPKKDGNMWFVLLGDNVQSGICGFGDTPMSAVKNFNYNFYNEKAS